MCVRVCVCVCVCVCGGGGDGGGGQTTWTILVLVMTRLTDEACEARHFKVGLMFLRMNPFAALEGTFRF